ncbi:MAG: GIY-YIG nuclease family protein [Candidatus Omnitrophica bacterium]|nr:GIY-YIG nuclease family protein [Candidatus Omnitrophota bacterium]
MAVFEGSTLSLNLLKKMCKVTLPYTINIERSDKGYYYGSTSNLKERLERHSKGYVSSIQHRRPVKLVYFERLANKRVVLRRERQFKYGRTRKATRDKLIREFPAERLKSYL